MISTFQVRSYLTYWLDSVDSHSLHSPFFFDFYNEVVLADRDQNAFARIEAHRRRMLSTPDTIAVNDLGAGSQRLRSEARRISDVARTSLTPPRLSRLYARIAARLQARVIVELGTSLGINTLYLAQEPQSQVTTFEGAPSIAALARDTFARAAVDNISLVEGDIDKTLGEFLLNVKQVDLAFIDANHRYEPTIRYFRQLAFKTGTAGIIILDDIHYSPGMEKAWNEIKKDPLVYGSVDLYRTGILFFDPSLNKQHVVLQY